MLPRSNGVSRMREMTVDEARREFLQIIAAAERGETTVITKNGTPIAKIAPQTADLTDDPERQSAFSVLTMTSGRSGRPAIGSARSPRKIITAATPHDAAVTGTADGSEFVQARLRPGSRRACLRA